MNPSADNSGQSRTVSKARSVSFNNDTIQRDTKTQKPRRYTRRNKSYPGGKCGDLRQSRLPDLKSEKSKIITGNDMAHYVDLLFKEQQRLSQAGSQILKRTAEMSSIFESTQQEMHHSPVSLNNSTLSNDTGWTWLKESSPADTLWLKWGESNLKTRHSPYMLDEWSDNESCGDSVSSSHHPSRDVALSEHSSGSATPSALFSTVESSVRSSYSHNKLNDCSSQASYEETLLNMEFGVNLQTLHDEVSYLKSRLKQAEDKIRLYEVEHVGSTMLFGSPGDFNIGSV